jgi:hypothetical protein
VRPEKRAEKETPVSPINFLTVQPAGMPSGVLLAKSPGVKSTITCRTAELSPNTPGLGPRTHPVCHNSARLSRPPV